MTNWSDIRRLFPVTDDSTYLNTAAAGPLARSTMAAASLYYEQMMQDGDVHWDSWLEKREEVRARVASFINAEPDEIGFTTNTSSGMNLIIDALEDQGEVISNELEFPVTIIPWMHRKIPVHIVKAVGGVIRLEDTLRAMNSKTGVLSHSYVQYSNGFRTNLDDLGNNKGRHWLVVNASQAAGVLQIDVKRMRIDALCATGHKWMLSGYGSGFVYISRELQSRTRPRSIGWLSVQNPYGNVNNEVHLRSDMSARAEMGCPHFAGIFALGASIELMQTIGLSAVEERSLQLNRLLTDSLSEAGWSVLSPLADESFRSAETLVQASEPSQLVQRLARKRILVTEKPEGIRVATDFFNDESDVENLIRSLRNVTN
ncbi:MAG TPA: aminotransferase class V-fold PLP-dependent enzyme [Pyrinomonadaceae bacterium]|nr:aminotransferase class V-fold PLP-dependent enzyme [Pyrinomonadaceae bacterium]